MKKSAFWVLLSCFLFAFLLHFISIYNINIAPPSDAENTWKMIKSFYSGDIYPAPQLYKGLHAVFPYVWLYHLSIRFGLNEFFFVKAYLAALFAFASAICLPYVISTFLKKRVGLIPRVIWILIAWWIWSPYGVFIALWVDLPNFAYLSIAAAASLMLVNMKSFSDKKKVFAYSLLAGLTIGLASGGSGQYMLTAFLLPVFIAIRLFRSKFDFVILKKSIFAPLICIIVVIIGIMPFKLYDYHFEKTIVQPFRDQGYWIPKGIGAALIRDMTMTTYVRGVPQLPDNRGEAILRAIYGHDAVNKSKDYYNENGYFPGSNGNGVQQGWQNTFKTSPAEYVKLVLKYPLDFIARWGQRFFLGIDMDNGTSSVSRLFVGFTLLYFTLYSIIKRCKTVKSIVCPNTLIVAAFVVVALIPCLAHMEKRYAISLQALIICVGLFDDTIKNIVLSVIDKIEQCVKAKSLGPVWNGKISYPAVIYVVFMVVCFMHHASIYETLGPSISILFS